MVGRSSIVVVLLLLAGACIELGILPTTVESLSRLNDATALTVLLFLTRPPNNIDVLFRPLTTRGEEGCELLLRAGSLLSLRIPNTRLIPRVALSEKVLLDRFERVPELALSLPCVLFRSVGLRFAKEDGGGCWCCVVGPLDCRIREAIIRFYLMRNFGEVDMVGKRDWSLGFVEWPTITADQCSFSSHTPFPPLQHR